MSASIFWIVFGTALIAVGGILATHGWNARTEETQKSAMVTSVAAEWLINTQAIGDPPLAETDKTKLSQFVIFPRMKIATLEGAISSGLFLGKTDREFYTRATNLRDIAADFNLRLGSLESNMLDNPGKITEIRTRARDGLTRRQIKAKLKKFAELLISKYGVDGDERFFVQLEEDATLPNRP